MKGYDGWNYHPYRPGTTERMTEPSIVRLAPSEHEAEVEWIGDGISFTILYALRGENSWQEMQVENEKSCQLKDLLCDQEYQLYVRDAKGRESDVRLIRTGRHDGVIVNYLHPDDHAYSFSGQYLCSPSILKVPDGPLLVSMDVFAGTAPQNLTLLFRSDDGGASWRYVTDIFPCFWGKLFWHQNKLFLLGVSKEYGDLLIGCSEDLGRSWSAPAVILRGSGSHDSIGNHRAPTVILKSHHRLWTGTEWHTSDSDYPFKSSLLSIDEGDNPMISGNWVISEWAEPDETWTGMPRRKWAPIEGNAVETPDGCVLNILRVMENQALVLKADPSCPERKLEFVEMMDFPAGHSKFEIQKGPDGVYYALGNQVPGRNILALYRSDDVRHWTKVKDIIAHPEYDIGDVGFQYPSFCIDGSHMHILSRTAWNHAHNFHDSNMITYHCEEII